MVVQNWITVRAKRILRLPTTKRVLKFTKRYSAQLSFAILVAIFLTVSVGEGQAYNVSTPLLAAELNTNTNGFFGKPQVFGDQTVTTGAVQQSAAIVYIVGDGDSITSIANRYSLSPGTILDANKISAIDANKIQPGQQLLIPAVDTNTSTAYLDAINQYEQQQAAAAAAQQAKIAAAQRANSSYSSGFTGSTNSYGVTYLGTEWGAYNGGIPGQCTWYVWSQRSFPGMMGNAGQYLSYARSYGLATGTVARVGAVIVTAESWYGHVGIVVAVGGGTVTIREMNYLGPGQIDQRTFSANASFIRGYVY